MPIPPTALDSVVERPSPEEARRYEVSEEIQEIVYTYIRANSVLYPSQLNQIQQAGDHQQRADNEKDKRKSGLIYRNVAELLNSWVVHMYIIPSLS